MKVVAFRHVPFEGAGRIESALKSHNLQLEYADIYQHLKYYPDLTDVAGVVVLGGPMSVNDDLQWLRHEERLIKEVLDSGLPVLGICLGSQLIAKIHGSKVVPNQATEIGWFNLHFAESAATDSLLCGLTEPEPVFHWHSETYDLPPGAELLASSDLCRNQAWRLGDRIYGFQFHLEITPEMIADWCCQDENCGDVRELVSPINPHFEEARVSSLATTVFNRWCNLVLQNKAY